MSDASTLAPALWGIPVVADAAARDAAFPLATRSQDQRVFNKGTASVERWSGSAWVVDLSNAAVGGAAITAAIATAEAYTDAAVPAGRTDGTLAAYVARNAVYNVLNYGAAADLTGDLSAVLAAIFAILPARGGRIRIPAGQYRALSPIIPPGRNVFMDNSRVSIELDAGAVIYSYDTTPGRALFDLSGYFGQDGELIIDGGILDGVNASATTIGINDHTDNVLLRNMTIRKFGGAGIKLTNDLSVPPIRCTIQNLRVLQNGKGIDANGSSCAGLLLDHCSVEASSGVGIDLTDCSTVTMIGCVVENSGRVTTTAENLLVMGNTDLTAIGCYFEDDAGQVHDSVLIDATANVMPGARFYGGRMVGQQTVTSRGFNVGPSGGAVRGVVISGVYMYGHKVGIQLGAGVTGYEITGNNWSDTYNPSGGTATRIINNSTGRGIINNLDRFAAAADSYEIHGPLSATGTGAINDALTVGLATGADKATGAGNYYDVGTFQGKVTAGAAVRLNCYSAVGNAAYLNAMASGTGLGAYLKSRGSAAAAELGVAQNVNLDMSLNGVAQATLDTGGLFNARLGFKVAGTQVLSTRQGAITTPNTQTASYVQADVTSLKTAIDAIRAVLIAHGLTS